ncbi:inactive glucose-1-phosphate adenylyltransferase small subunit 2, chloroplastic isoform X3 [Vitis riparia]|uniref:inactive glucose-1-phosphate adenylyltransferase small subunit 2, chloroplastic isoform X3 n=1 Tax=Vitis riparia TaxID=96939 RepID=UPI00155B3E84|nr:inactive glucose-1-phosphate adenylyltransferase small subunit 2, chloroplastic isoform X3 [Vitis riparia]
MVILQLALPTTSSANLRPKLPSLGGKQVTVPPSLCVSNSQQSEHPTSSSRPANRQSVAAIVFGDGSESQLYPLTKRRSEGAVHIAGSYRLIDAVVSNCINSNITKIYALTQFNSTSLNSHLCRAYSGVGLEVVAAYQSPEARGWFQGTADAVRRCLWLVEEHPVAEFLVLPGYHLYRMDYQKLIQAHQQSKADITIVALSAEISRETGFGFLEVNSENQVVEFSKRSEKEPATIISVKSPRKSNDNGYKKLASMGIYVVKKEIMIKLLREHFPKANGFGSEVIPGAISIGMKRCEIRGTIVGLRTKIGDRAVIEDSVIMGSDIYQQAEDELSSGMKGTGNDIPIGIGEDTHIRKAIVDKNARIGKQVLIVNRDNVQEGNREAHGYTISEGIVVVLKGAVIPDGSIL